MTKLILIQNDWLKARKRHCNFAHWWTQAWWKQISSLWTRQHKEYQWISYLHDWQHQSGCFLARASSDHSEGSWLNSWRNSKSVEGNPQCSVLQDQFQCDGAQSEYQEGYEDERVLQSSEIGVWTSSYAWAISKESDWSTSLRASGRWWLQICSFQRSVSSFDGCRHCDERLPCGDHGWPSLKCRSAWPNPPGRKEIELWVCGCISAESKETRIHKFELQQDKLERVREVGLDINWVMRYTVWKNAISHQASDIAASKLLLPQVNIDF